jgi:sugar O-acyltransferase (sialic acid O-acetyltransferase NeuD family)
MTISIIGNGGLSRELQAYITDSGIDYNVYVSDEYFVKNNNVNKLSDLDPINSNVIVAIADTRKKYQLINQLPEDTNYVSFVHPKSIIYSLDNIGIGTIVGPNSVITTNVKIGNHCLINCNVTIGHDTVIDNYCTLNPGVSLSGNCIVNEGVFIGSSSSIREKITIAEWTTIGMGTVVVKSIYDSDNVYVGVPARSIK